MTPRFELVTDKIATNNETNLTTNVPVETRTLTDTLRPHSTDYEYISLLRMLTETAAAAIVLKIFCPAHSKHGLNCAQTLFGHESYSRRLCMQVL